MNKLILIMFSCLFVANSFAATTKTADAEKPIEQRVRELMDKLAPDKRTALEKRLASENQVAKHPFGIAFYKPTYILPYYYTRSPYQQIYQGNTPDNQKVKSTEFKAQFSVQVPLWHNILGKDSTLNIGYTQLSYWQFYAHSQYFRETNYEPEIFLSKALFGNMQFTVGAVHQSNGRGGSNERSWNRAYADAVFSGGRWWISFRPWVLIFKSDSSYLHNSDIAHYMGHARTVFAYKNKYQHVLSVMLRNNIESAFKRGTIEVSYSVPISAHLNVFAQFFNGYGQSLLEYNHRTLAYGIGLSLSNLI